MTKPRPGQGVQLLLVEDNLANRDMLRRRLLRRGFQVEVAGDGAEALERAHLPGLSVVLMDLSLPVMDGWEATRRLRADPATRHLHVIALTAHAMRGDRERALDAGCDAFQTKPIDLDQLVTQILAGHARVAG